jgi:DNA-binding PadR family transcriptional regulator
VSRSRRGEHPLLLGEWACLGIVYPAPIHGFAVAARLKPEADIGRVWSLSRALTYRALDQLTDRGYLRPVGEEPGIAGGNRTLLAATRTGRAQLRAWVDQPVAHLRDVRSELLLKLVIADWCAFEVGEMLRRQRERVVPLAQEFGVQVVRDPRDVVARWRLESANAALRFVDGLTS